MLFEARAARTPFELAAGFLLRVLIATEKKTKVRTHAASVM